MKKLLVAILFIALLSGCSAKKTVTSCVYNETGITMKADIVAEDDKVMTMVETVTMTYESMGIAEGTDEQTIIDALNSAYESTYNQTGVTYTVSVEDSNIIVVVTIDYTVVDNATLIEMGFLSEDDADVDYISLITTVSDAENSGAVCTVSK